MRVLTTAELSIVAGGGYGDDITVIAPDPDGTYASYYSGDDWYKTDTYTDSNGDIVVTAPEQDPLSNYDWASWAEVTFGVGATTILTDGGGTPTAIALFAGGAAVGSPTGTKYLDEINRNIAHNGPLRDYSASIAAAP